MYCSITKQLALSGQYSDLHLGYVLFEFDCDMTVLNEDFYGVYQSLQATM